MMIEENPKYFNCEQCGINYDLENFKWLDNKWTKKHLRRKDYKHL